MSAVDTARRRSPFIAPDWLSEATVDLPIIGAAMGADLVATSQPRRQEPETVEFASSTVAWPAASEQPTTDLTAAMPTAADWTAADSAEVVQPPAVSANTDPATAESVEADPATPDSAEEHSADKLPKSAVLWSYLLTVGRLATTGIVTIFMAAYLLPADYGVMALAMVWVTFAQTLALHGTGQAVIQREEVDESHFDAAFWTTVSGSTLLALIFAGVAPFWARLTGTPELVPVCFALAPAIVLNALVVVPDAILRRALRFRTLSLRVLIAGILSGVAGVLAAVNGMGVWALVVQQMVLTTFSAVAVWAAVPWRPRFRRIGPALREIRSYSLHSVSGFFAGFLSERTDALLLGPIFGPVAIGLYRFASRITDMVNDVAVGGLGQVSMPHLSRFAAERDAFAKAVARIMHAGALLALPLFGILFVTAPWLLTWIGPQWADAVPAFRALCIGSAAGAIGAILGAVLQAAGRPGTIAAIGWCTAVATAGLMFAVGRGYSSHPPREQVFAIAVTYAAIQTLSLLAALVVVYGRLVRISIYAGLRPSLPAAAASGAAVAAGFLVQPLIHGVHPFVGLVVTGAAATVAGSLVLIAADREVAERVGPLIGSRHLVGARRRGRHSMAGARAAGRTPAFLGGDGPTGADQPGTNGFVVPDSASGNPRRSAAAPETTA
jgi:PST family polysaccharide transporter